MRQLRRLKLLRDSFVSENELTITLLESKEFPNIDLSEEQRQFVCSSEKIQRFLKDADSLGYHIIYENRIVGFIHLDKFDDGYFLHNFMIDINYQNKGIGNEAIKELLLLMKEREIKNLYTTYIWGNDVAKHLYTKLGFKELRVIDEDGIHEVDMVYTLC